MGLIVLGSFAVFGSWVSFEGSSRAVMAVSVLLAIAPVLAALVSERIWLGNVEDPSRWSSGTGWWDPPILQGNVGAFSRIHLETEKGAALSGVMWRGRRKAWEGRRPVRFFADQERIVVSPTDAAVFRTLKRS